LYFFSCTFECRRFTLILCRHCSLWMPITSPRTKLWCNITTPSGSVARCQLNLRLTLHVNSQIIWLSDLFIFRRVRKERKATISFIMCVCLIFSSSFHPSAWNHSTPTRRILIKFDILLFFENLLRKFEFDWILKRKANLIFCWPCIYITIT
jgi:hypothetical protein